MTQEEKQLLLITLCGMLPYGVMVENVLTHRIFDLSKYLHCLPGALENFKPYLRSMLSMTEEEAAEFEILSDKLLTEADNTKIWNSVVDWLNEHHFDHRGLIPMGLALEAPEDMYK